MKMEIEFRGRTAKSEWVYGYLVCIPNGDSFECYIISDFDERDSIYDLGKYAIKVIPETVGQYTGITDKEGKKVYVGDKVKFFGMVGEVCFEQGCFGIGTQETIDWKKIKKQILPLTGCDNKPYFCENDNFVSFWELIWNFNGEDEQCDVCEVIDNIFDKESD
jgi:hypothetical protein